MAGISILSPETVAEIQAEESVDSLDFLPPGQYGLDGVDHTFTVEDEPTDYSNRNRSVIGEIREWLYPEQDSLEGEVSIASRVGRVAALGVAGLATAACAGEPPIGPNPTAVDADLDYTNMPPDTVDAGTEVGVGFSNARVKLSNGKWVSPDSVGFEVDGASIDNVVRGSNGSFNIPGELNMGGPSASQTAEHQGVAVLYYGGRRIKLRRILRWIATNFVDGINVQLNSIADVAAGTQANYGGLTEAQLKFFNNFTIGTDSALVAHNGVPMAMQGIGKNRSGQLPVAIAGENIVTLDGWVTNVRTGELFHAADTVKYNGISQNPMRQISGEVIGFFEAGVGGRNSARRDSSGTRMPHAWVFYQNRAGTVKDSAQADALGAYVFNAPFDMVDVEFAPGAGQQEFLAKRFTIPAGMTDLGVSPIVYQTSDGLTEYLHRSLFRDVVLSIDPTISDDRNARDFATNAKVPDSVWVAPNSRTAPRIYHVQAGFDVNLLNEYVDSLAVFDAATGGLATYDSILVHDPNIDESQFRHAEFMKTLAPFPTQPSLGRSFLLSSPVSAPGSANNYDFTNVGYALGLDGQLIPQSIALVAQLEFLMTEKYASYLGGPEGSSVSPMLSSSGVSPNGPEWRVLEVTSHRAEQDNVFLVTWPDYAIGALDPKR